MRKVPEQILLWDGAERMSAMIANEGFALPNHFVALTAPLVNRREIEWRDELRLYARQYVRSGCSPTNLTGEISEKLAFARKELVFNATARERFLVLEREWKIAELANDSTLEAKWTGRKAELRTIVQEIAQAWGFQLTRKGFCASLSGGLKLEVIIDIGTKGSTVSQIVMLNRLNIAKGNWEMWLPWDELLPGMGFYANGDDAATLVWGAKALVMAAKAFASTF